MSILEVSISINSTDPENKDNPGKVIPAKIETKNGFLDVYYKDPILGQETRITILNSFIDELRKNYQVQK